MPLDARRFFPDPWELFHPAELVDADFWIHLSRTSLADTMTKLRLLMFLNVVLESLPMPGISSYPFAVGTDRNEPAQHLNFS